MTRATRKRLLARAARRGCTPQAVFHLGLARCSACGRLFDPGHPADDAPTPLLPTCPGCRARRSSL